MLGSRVCSSTVLAVPYGLYVALILLVGDLAVLVGSHVLHNVVHLLLKRRGVVSIASVVGSITTEPTKYSPPYSPKTYPTSRKTHPANPSNLEPKIQVEPRLGELPRTPASVFAGKQRTSLLRESGWSISTLTR